jgi:hypothetical protein
VRTWHMGCICLLLSGVVFGCVRRDSHLRYADPDVRPEFGFDWNPAVFDYEFRLLKKRITWSGPVSGMRLRQLDLCVPPEVRRLARYGPQSNVVLLKYLYKDETAPEAAACLGVTGDDASLDDLIAVLESCKDDARVSARYIELRSSLVWSLRNLTGKTMATHPYTCSHWLGEEKLANKWRKWRKNGGKALPRNRRKRKWSVPKMIVFSNARVSHVAGFVPDVRTKVVDVRPETGHVALGVGKTSGIKAGFIFLIHRGDEYIGRVRVTSVWKEFSGGTIVEQKKPIKAGDDAMTDTTPSP